MEQKRGHKKKNNLFVGIIIIVFLMVLALVLFLPKEKVPEIPEQPFCGNGICDVGENFSSCGKDCCYPEGEYIPVIPDVKCCSGLETGANYDMNCVLNHDNECEPCALVGASVCIRCGDGVCGLGENFCNCIEDCKPTAIKTGIYGYVSLWQGDCMPPIGTSSNCKKEFIETKVKVYLPVKESEMRGTYLTSEKTPLMVVDSDEFGYYYFELPNGMYSVFAEDPLNSDKEYCNSLGGGYACLTKVSNQLAKFEIAIDHSTH
ncbi:MAG: hypothetical protein ACPLXC_01380 [Candidatus Pacearchaeota archaeon]